MQKLKKPVSVLLTLIMVLSLFTIVPFTAGALDGVGYIDENGESQTADGVTAITSGTTSLNAGWYAVTSTVTNDNRITCTGDVYLILCDNAKLTGSSGITVDGDNSLTIYGQSAGTGELAIDIQIAEDDDAHHRAAIGSDSNKRSGAITFNGGVINVTSNALYSAVIGGGDSGDGTVTVNGGTVTATAFGSGAAIGGGYGNSGNVTINGGSVTATVSGSGAAIGGGYIGRGSVTINGGTVTAAGGDGAAGIGGGFAGDGIVTINGGSITATSTGGGAAIGGGRDIGAAVTVNGGSVTATADNDSVGIGGGANSLQYSIVNLSWTNDDDSITASSYIGTVTLKKNFVSDSTWLYPGTVSDNGTIANKTLAATAALQVAGHSISLNGDIGLNYYLVIIEEANVHFEWYNKTYDYTVTAADFDAASGLYKVQLNVAAAEMSCPITATLTEGDFSVTETYSVRDYADVILNSESAFSQSYIAANGNKQYGVLTDLIKKMLDYGAKAQTRFGVTDVPLANSGVDYTMQPVTVYHIDTQKSDMTADLHKYGIDYIGTSIVFLSATTIRHNYVISDNILFEKVKDTANFDFVDKGARICFELKDIPAAQLDVAKAFTLGDSVYRYSVLDYCKLVIADERKPQADRELAMATYWYNNAAKAYFYANDEYEDDMV